MPGSPCFAADGIENRYTVGFDSVWRSGPFSFAPTIYYQWGERDLVSSLGKFAGVEHNQKEHAWFVDLRGGWQAGPLLVEGALIYTTGNKARSDIRDANRDVNFYQPLVTDAGYNSGGWGEIWGPGIDYFQIMRANATGISPTYSMGFDKYGLGRVGARATYALTPAFSLRAAANGNWAAQGVDTGGAIAAATGITPGTSGTCANAIGGSTCRTSPGKLKNYLGTELDLGFTYRLAPGLVLDVVGGYMFSGPALRAATASPVCAGDAVGTSVCGSPTVPSRPETNPKNISVVTARVRYTF